MAVWNPGVEKRAKGGTTTQAREFEFCVALKTQKYDWLMLRALTTRCQHSRCVTSCRNVYLAALEPEQIKASEMRLTGRDVLTIPPTGYGKSKIYQVFCLAKLLASNPNASALVNSPLNTMSTASSKNNSVNMNWLSLAFLPSIWKIEPEFHLKPDIHFKLSGAIGKHFTAVEWSPMSNTYVNSRFKLFFWKFRNNF